MSTKQSTTTDPWRGMFDPARLPPMDMRTFFVQHPDMPDFDTERWPNDAAQALKRLGFDCAVFDVDIPIEVEDLIEWVRNWKPSAPEHARVAFYGDSEGGPYFMAVWPTPPQPTSAAAPATAHALAAMMPATRSVAGMLVLIGLLATGVGGVGVWLAYKDITAALTEVKLEAAEDAALPSSADPVDPAEVADKILADAAAAAGQAPATTQPPAPQEPQVIAVPVETFASAGSALQLANQIVARKTQPTLELQGNAMMPKREPLDVIGRALGLKDASAQDCTIRLSEQATSVDYRMAMAMSMHFAGKVCVPHSIKVEGGRTLMEMYLKGHAPPTNVTVLGLDDGVSLRGPSQATQSQDQSAKQS